MAYIRLLSLIWHTPRRENGSWKIETGKDMERSRCGLNDGTHPEFNWSEEENKRDISKIVCIMAKLLIKLIRNE